MKRGIILAGLLCWLLAPPERLPGHGVLGRVVQHHIVATVEASHLEVTVEVTFHSVFAQRERRRLDADGDGLIRAAETRRYLDEILGALEAGLRISAGKREINLTTLHPPEVDLLENEAAGAHPLRVRASYVARLDDRMRQEGPVELEDQLWPEAPALSSLQVRSRERSGGLARGRTCFFGPRNARRFRLKLCPRVASVIRQADSSPPEGVPAEGRPRR
ncbi:MAG: hypothetical protein OXU26_15705 [Acidobacteriota bacterium]|nr:hypothetical protein [Acidobacteriota bacterium]